jgi:hypothetical protein
MPESRPLRIARLRDEIKRKRARVQVMERRRQYQPEQRKDQLEATIRTLNQEISTAAAELHQLEVQLIRESLES